MHSRPLLLWASSEDDEMPYDTAREEDNMMANVHTPAFLKAFFNVYVV